MSDTRIEAAIQVKLEDLLTHAMENATRSVTQMGEELVKTGEKAKGSGGLFDGMLGNLAKIGLAVGGFVALKDAGTHVVGMLVEAATATVTHASEISKLRRELGLTSDEASKLSYVGQRLNLDTDALSMSFGKFSKFLVDNADKLDELHLEVIKTKDGHIDFGKTLDVVADRFRSMPDGVEKSALAMELFGKSGKDLLPLLNKGSSGLHEMGDEAVRMGLVLDDKALAASKRYRDSLKTLQETKEALINRISTAFLPVLADSAASLATLATQKVPQLLAKFDDLKAKITTGLTPAFAGMGGAIVSAVTQAGHGIGGLGEIFDVLTGKQPGAGGELRAAIGDQLAEAVMGAVAGVRERAKSAFTEIGELFGKIYEAAEPKIRAFVGKLDELKDRFENLPKPLKDLVASMAVAAVAVKATGLEDTLVNLIGALGNFAQGAVAVGAVIAGRGGLVGALRALASALGAALIAFWPAAAVVGIVGGLIFISQHTEDLRAIWEAFSYAATAVWNRVTKTVGDFFDFIGTKIHEFFEPFGKLLDLFITDFPQALGIAYGAVFKTVAEILITFVTFVFNALSKIEELKTGIILKFFELAGGAIKAVEGLASGAWDALVHFATVDVPAFLAQLRDNLLGTGGKGGIGQAAGDAVAGFIKGIVDKIPAVIETAIEFAKRFIKGVKEAFGIRSPSAVMAEVGEQLDAGLAMGVDAGKGEVLAAVGRVAAEAAAVARQAALAIAGTFRTNISGSGVGLQNTIAALAGYAGTIVAAAAGATTGASGGPTAVVGPGGSVAYLQPGQTATYGIPRFHTGGPVGRGGLAELAAGETVLAAGTLIRIEVPVTLDGKVIARIVNDHNMRDAELKGGHMR